MGKIKVLPPHEAQKIAAGEVVERPANVTKELLENALDAGATTISLFIEDGGKQSIKIIDNGCGMSPEDARLCIQNHATSKLTSVDDLSTIATFGFRGEALASVACVSHMTITTKEESASEGTRFTIENGAILKEEPTSCNTGTTIEINDLFYNVPARKKFLKKRETEWRAIQQIFVAFSLDNCSKSFSLHHDGKRTLHCPAVETIQERMAQVFDTNLVKEMITCSDKNDSIGLKLSGAISRPTYSRYDRNQILLFVNHRWIKNYKLSQAVIKGYTNILPPRRYPAACIFIEIDPEQVDVNIHPRKEEVQFLHPIKVERSIETMVKQALELTFEKDLGKVQNTTSHLPSSAKSFGGQADTNLYKPKPTQAPSWNFGSAKNTAKFEPQEIKQSTPAPHIIKTSPAQPEVVQQQNQLPLQVDQDHPEDSMYNYQLIGQIHDTYLVIQTDEGLVMMDQHAAHERILYEQFAERFEDVATTQLMFPQLITLAQADCELLLPYLSFFIDHGIILEQFSDHQLTVKALPVYLKDTAIEDLVKSAVGWINEYSHLDKELFTKEINDKVRAMMACKAAVKAGDKLDEKQMHELIKTLHVTKNKMTCPHGRPTTWSLSKTEIEKKFQRDYLGKK